MGEVWSVYGEYLEGIHRCIKASHGTHLSATGNHDPAVILQQVDLLCKLSIASVNVIVWASCQIRKIAGCACAGNAGNVFPTYRLQSKPEVSDPGMHHGTCVTHVPWCMSESLIRGGGENVPGIPGACATRNFAYLARGPFGNILGMVRSPIKTRAFNKIPWICMCLKKEIKMTLKELYGQDFFLFSNWKNGCNSPFPANKRCKFAYWWLYRWILGVGKWFHPTLYLACVYLSMLELKLNHVSKRTPYVFLFFMYVVYQQYMRMLHSVLCLHVVILSSSDGIVWFIDPYHSGLLMWQ